MAERMLTTGQAAKLFSVTPDTVLKWIKAGRVPARRTPGGHYRIDPRELERLIPRDEARPFRFCWEYNANGGEVLDECLDCLVYKARAHRCYEMIELGKANGHSLVFCRTTCEECEYFRLVHGQAANVLVVSLDEETVKQLRAGALAATYNLAVAECEYSLSALVEDFRPDFVVIDGAMGIDRAREMANHLVQDPRVALVRVVLAATEEEFPKECNRRIFARIDRPFGIQEISDCIAGLREDLTSGRA